MQTGLGEAGLVVEGKLRAMVKGLLSLSFAFCHLSLNSSFTISKAVDIHVTKETNQRYANNE